MPQWLNFDQALAYLLSLGHETLTIKLGLENTETLLAALGNPEKTFPAVQIAGTNGKGSTAAMLDSICRQAGIRTGLFTSPHLISITERIRIDGRQISETEFARCTSMVADCAQRLVEDGHLQTLPTFFEQVTAIGLVAFREAKIDLAILETGLGGRLDSTTAAGANFVAITPIAMDHEEYLGDTLAEIAAEKAAIIRPGVLAVVAEQSGDARDVILKRSAEVGVKPRFVAVNAAHAAINLSLRGRHQLTNAATAIAIAEALGETGFAISREAIVRGLESAKHAGRLELWPSEPEILFDGAHNPAAARALRDYLDEFVKAPITMIFGAMRDKRILEMAGILFPKACRLILTEMDNVRAANLAELSAAVPANFPRENVNTASTVVEAIRLAHGITPVDGLICVTGSLYLVGAAQELIAQHFED